jgi:flavin-binding protein dodecin
MEVKLRSGRSPRSGSSPRSWQAAADEAVKRANKTLRGVTGIHVIEQKAHVEKGKITEYRTTIEVTFILD